MSTQTIRERAAEVRRNWTRSERRQRANASDRRCLELLLRIGGVPMDRRGRTWSTKTSA
jgi:hypothetical protein